MIAEKLAGWDLRDLHTRSYARRMLFPEQSVSGTDGYTVAHVPHGVEEALPCGVVIVGLCFYSPATVLGVYSGENPATAGECLDGRVEGLFVSSVSAADKAGQKTVNVKSNPIINQKPFQNKPKLPHTHTHAHCTAHLHARGKVRRIENACL